MLTALTYWVDVSIDGGAAQIIFAPLVLAAYTALVTSELVDADVAGLSAYGHGMVRCPLAGCILLASNGPQQSLLMPCLHQSSRLLPRCAAASSSRLSEPIRSGGHTLRDFEPVRA